MQKLRGLMRRMFRVSWRQVGKNPRKSVEMIPVGVILGRSLKSVMGDKNNTIGLKRGTVKLVPHNPEWDELFRLEKIKLLKVVGEIIIDIQHVGSTAIPTISAKPIIDIAVVVKSLEEVEKCVKKIEALGYQRKQENRPERLFFTKGPEENRTVYLHIGDESTDYIKDMIMFRDYLIQHPATSKKYMELKTELAEKFSDNREPYTAAKEKLVRQVLEIAKKIDGKKNGRNAA